MNNRPPFTPNHSSISGFQPFFFINVPLIVPPAPQLQIPTVKVQPSSKKEGIHINLTVQQLLEAGYEGNKRSWSQKEDNLLMRLAKKTNLSWKQIGEKIAGRTTKMCYSRYRRIQNRSKERWTKKEDKKICELVEHVGENWKKISEMLPRRSAKQIQDHYMNYLRPEINKQPWSLEEDLLLIGLLEEFGKDWPEIEKRLNGRTQNQIKNRFFGRLKRLEDKKRQKQEIDEKQQQEEGNQNQSDD